MQMQVASQQTSIKSNEGGDNLAEARDFGRLHGDISSGGNRHQS